MEGLVEACATQLRDVCAGEILILRAQLIRHFDESNMRRGSNHRANHADEVEKRARGTGSDIEQSARLRMLEKPADDGNTILDINEIALLAAVGVIRTVRFEQAHGFTGFDGREDLADERLHDALVGLVRTIDVKELKPYPLLRCRLATSHIVDDTAIDKVLAPAVSVEGVQPRKGGGALLKPAAPSPYVAAEEA